MPETSSPSANLDVQAERVLQEGLVNFERVTAQHIDSVRGAVRQHLCRQHPSIFTWLDGGGRWMLQPGSNGNGLHYVIREENKGQAMQNDGVYEHPERGWSVKPLPSDMLEAHPDD